MRLGGDLLDRGLLLAGAMGAVGEVDGQLVVGLVVGGGHLRAQTGEQVVDRRGRRLVTLVALVTLHGQLGQLGLVALDRQLGLVTLVGLVGQVFDHPEGDALDFEGGVDLRFRLAVVLDLLRHLDGNDLNVLVQRLVVGSLVVGSLVERLRLRLRRLVDLDGQLGLGARRGRDAGDRDLAGVEQRHTRHAPGIELGLDGLDRELVVVGLHPPAGRLGGELGLGHHDGELGGGLLDRAPHERIGVEQALASGAQLLELGLAGAAAPRQVLQDALPHHLGLGHHLAALLAGGLDFGLGIGRGLRAQRLGLGGGALEHLLGLEAHGTRGGIGLGTHRLGVGAGIDPDRLGFGLGVGDGVSRPLLGLADDGRRRGLGLGGAQPQQLGGLRGETGGLVLGVADELGGLGLGLGPDLGSRLAGGLEDPRRLLAEQDREPVLVEHLLLALARFELGDAALELALAVEHLTQPSRDRPQVGPHLHLVESAEAGGELAASDPVGFQFGRIDHSVMLPTPPPAVRYPLQRRRQVRGTGSGSPPSSTRASRASSRVATSTMRSESPARRWAASRSASLVEAGTKNTS